MEVELINLSLGNHGIQLLFLLPALINLIIFCYISFVLPQNKLSNTFSAFLIMLCLAQFCNGMLHMSITHESATFWDNISKAPWIFVMPFGVKFALEYTGTDKKLNNPLLQIALFAPAIIFLCGVLGGAGKDILLKSVTWNWISNPAPTLFNDLLFGWISLMGILMMSLFWIHWIRLKKDEPNEVQTLILAMGITLPVIGGILSEIIFPLVLGLNDVPLAAPFITSFSIAAFIGLRDFNLLEYSPLDQWDKVVATMNEGVVISNLDSKIQYANKKFCEIVDCEFHELKDRSGHEMFLEEDERKLMTEVIASRKRKESSEYEMKLRLKSGDYKWVKISGTPYLDSKGDVIGTIGLFTDITHLKRTQSNLSDKIEELNRLMYKASHDLRSPNINIQGLINVYKQQPGQDIAKLFMMIEKCNNQSLLTIDNLANISSILHKEIELETMCLEGEILSIVKNMNPSNTVEVACDIQLEGSFKSDKMLLNYLLRNLLENAFKYKDGRKLKSKIEISVVERNGLVKIKISDNGQGIPEGKQNEVFGMFLKANSASGVGLGLYTAKCAAEKLSGSIKMKSTERIGSEFTVILPVFQLSEAEA